MPFGLVYDVLKEVSGLGVWGSHVVMFCMDISCLILFLVVGELHGRWCAVLSDACLDQFIR